jgi:outer membrane cobalamin receptor
MFSPSIRGVLDLGHLAVEAAYRDGFSPPTLSDLFFQEGVLVRANPELQPERVHGEISLTLRSRMSYGGAILDSRVSAYNADVDDMILWFPDFRFVWSPENFDVEREGIEAGSSIQTVILGRPFHLSGQADWSWVRYRGSALTGQIAYRPRFNAQAASRWAWGRATPSLRFTWVGPRRSIAGSPLNALPSYHLLDLALALPLRLGIAEGQIDLTLSNATDQRPSLLADYPLPGRGWAVDLKLLLPHGT